MYKNRHSFRSLLKGSFPSMPHIIGIVKIVNKAPILYTNIMTKFDWIKVFKLSKVYRRVALRRQTDRQLSISINKTVIAYANMRDTRAHNFIRSVSKNMINQSRRKISSRTVALRSQFKSPIKQYSMFSVSSILKSFSR